MRATALRQRLTAAALSVDETIAIWISYDDYRSRARFTLSARALCGIIRSELDVQAELVG